MKFIIALVTAFGITSGVAGPTVIDSHGKPIGAFISANSVGIGVKDGLVAVSVTFYASGGQLVSGQLDYEVASAPLYFQAAECVGTPWLVQADPPGYLPAAMTVIAGIRTLHYAGSGVLGTNILASSVMGTDGGCAGLAPTSIEAWPRIGTIDLTNSAPLSVRQ